MFQGRVAAAFAMILAFAAVPALAQQDRHHPGTAAGLAGPSPSGMPQGMPSGGMAGVGSMPMMAMMRMMVGQNGMAGMAMLATAMTEHVEGRLAFLKTELKITAAQMPFWNKFAQAVRDNAKTMRSMMQGRMMQSGMTATSQSANLPNRLALRETMMTAHLDALRKLKAAVDPLYAAFSDEQKKAADQMMLSPMGMM
jgi:hypothetical protein